jgi:hypothetical protein
VLLRCGQSRVQREDLGVAQVQPAERLGGVADLPLAAEEDEDVAGPFGAQLLDRVADRLDLVGVVLGQDRPVPHLDRVRPSGDLDDRRAVEVRREPFRVDRRGRDDDPEVRAAGKQLLHVPEDEIDVEGSLVCLVDDQGVVLVEASVGGQFGEQDAVGHQLDERVRAGLVGEPHLVADSLPEFGAELFGDPVGDGTGGEAARLRVPDEAAYTPAEFEADLRDLGGLAGPGLAGDDHDLVVADRFEDLVFLLADRQLFRVRDARDVRPARGHGGGRLVYVAGKPEALVGSVLLAQLIEPAPQASLVAQRQLG